MKIWIVGSRGLLGSAFFDIVRSLGIDCVASSRDDADVSNENSLNAFVKVHPNISHIVNCSAFSLVDLAEKEKEKAWNVNGLGPEYLGKIATHIHAKMIHISTDYVFDGSLNRSLREDDPIHPLNYYGETKREGEIRLLKVNPDACIVRTSSIFGSGGKNFVAKLLTLFGTEKEIFLSNDQWVRPTYAQDLSLAILQICCFFQSGIYHFANQGAATKFEFACAMKDTMEKMKRPFAVQTLRSVSSHFFPSLCKRPVYSVFDTHKIEKTFQIEIRSWQEALEEFLMETACVH